MGHSLNLKILCNSKSSLFIEGRPPPNPFLEKRGTRTTFHKNVALFMFLLRLELMGKAGGKGGAESFLKNANLYHSIQTATSTLFLFKSRQRLQTFINQ